MDRKLTKSILQSEKECFFCKTTLNLDLHHIFFGVANRKISDQDGCVVYLCASHHTGAKGVHHNRDLDLKLKRICERAWLEYYDKTIDDFIRRYGKNFI